MDGKRLSPSQHVAFSCESGLGTAPHEDSVPFPRKHPRLGFEVDGKRLSPSQHVAFSCESGLGTAPHEDSVPFPRKHPRLGFEVDGKRLSTSQSVAFSCESGLGTARHEDSVPFPRKQLNSMALIRCRRSSPSAPLPESPFEASRKTASEEDCPHFRAFSSATTPDDRRPELRPLPRGGSRCNSDLCCTERSPKRILSPSSSASARPRSSLEGIREKNSVPFPGGSDPTSFR